ncbi:FAD binding domain-containing protein [Effusibacillus dendaii]|uniref:Xanthine dehydrogenase n=1 Tax=Effusibacillus dendaii TaxID=2743772 RepID=A0A7I8D831_9BACL|nr:FAD binding domain-containing protein [Effusibacillus dendaii]BCJ86323.1 xanthine dehydrogenase [Effusibacillus dendaii]
MISFDFAYHRPLTLPEAVQLHQYLTLQEKQPVYYAGGTEIITLARMNQLYTKAVIDIKRIPECNVLEFRHDKLVLGTALTLTQLAEANVFPLLTETAGRAADHTARSKITLGGNICGSIIYREAVLPFLLADSQVMIAGKKGIRVVPIPYVFVPQLWLEEGEFAVQLITDRSYVDAPYVSVKKRKLETIDYPLVTVAALKKENRIRTAFSGLVPFPFRSLEMEDILNNRHLPLETRVEEAVRHLPGPIIDDIRGSAEYRKFVLKNTLTSILKRLEEVRE